MKEDYFHVYGGVGEIFGLSTIRFGMKDIEVGLLNRKGFGITKLFYQDNIFAQAGGIINANASLGLFGGLGIEWDFWNFISLRTEANISHGFDNYASSEVILGLVVFW
jgi:hypothetical protein